MFPTFLLCLSCGSPCCVLWLCIQLKWLQQWQKLHYCILSIWWRPITLCMWAPPREFSNYWFPFTSILKYLIKTVLKLCFCILPAVSVSAEILSCGAEKILEFIVSSPLLITSISVCNSFHLMSPVHKLTPMNICCCPLRLKILLLWLLARRSLVWKRLSKVIVGDSDY